MSISWIQIVQAGFLTGLSSLASASDTPVTPPPAQVATPVVKQAKGQEAEAASPGHVAPDVQNQTNPAYLLKLAAVHIEFGALDRAEPLLRTALEHAKDPVQKRAAAQMLTEILRRKGDVQGAAAEQQETELAKMTNPVERGRASLALADQFLHTNEPERAEKLLTDLLKPDRDHPADPFIHQSALRMLIRIWQAKPGRLDVVIADAEAAVAKDETDTASLEELCELYSVAKHDIVKSATYAEKFAALKPTDMPTQYRLAGLYQQGKQYDKAIALYKKLIARPGARKEEIHSQSFQIGMLLLQADRKDEAVAWITDTFAKSGTTQQDYSMLAMFYERADMGADAEAALTHLAENGTTPDEKADARMRIADLALRKKDFAKAEAVATAVQLDFKTSANAQNRANAMLKRIEGEKNKSAVGTPVIATNPNTADSKPMGPVLPPNFKPVPPTPLPSPATKAGADAKPVLDAQPASPANTAAQTSPADEKK